MWILRFLLLSVLVISTASRVWAADTSSDESIYERMRKPQPEEFCKTASTEFKGITLRYAVMDARERHCILDEKAYSSALEIWGQRTSYENRRRRFSDVEIPGADRYVAKTGVVIHGAMVRNPASEEADLAGRISDKVYDDVEAYKRQILR